MQIKGTKIYSILTLTCPKCQEGKLFVKSSAYIKGLADMHKTCSNCHEKFEREPGFYYGAAYVSYGLTVGLWIALWVALFVFDTIGIMSFSFQEDALLYLILGVVLLIALLPILYRLSRAVWINLFVKYNANAVEISKEKEAGNLTRKK